MTKKKSASTRISKKQAVLLDIFLHCVESNQFEFDNELVKEISNNHSFRNPFDATKIDNLSMLPRHIREQGYCVAHLGQGRHKFITEQQYWFHNFEQITNKETPWKYRKSALNETDSSESNILSVGFNQRIVHDFLYDDIVATPKMYGSRRTKISTSYNVGSENIDVTRLQLEIDLITEYQGVVTVFEGKNKFPDDFAVYQLFHPFAYFNKLQKDGKISIKQTNCCYLLRKFEKGQSIIRMYLYTFDNPDNIASIRLIKCDQYRLVER